MQIFVIGKESNVSVRDMTNIVGIFLNFLLTKDLGINWLVKQVWPNCVPQNTPKEHFGSNNVFILSKSVHGNVHCKKEILYATCLECIPSENPCFTQHVVPFHGT